MRHLLFVAVLVTVGLLVSGQPNNNFAFYKLSLRWPPSVCNDPKIKCKPSILTSFTIHGLWPELADDTPVPAYDPVTNRCTDVTPISPDQILVPNYSFLFVVFINFKIKYQLILSFFSYMLFSSSHKHGSSLIFCDKNFLTLTLRVNNMNDF